MRGRGRKGRAFAGLRELFGRSSARDGAVLTDAAAASLAVHGIAAELLPDAAAAAFASSDAALVPCDTELVDRFDGRLLLDSVARWAARGGAAAGAADADVSADASALHAERYHGMDPAREHLLEEEPCLPESSASGGGAGAGGESGGDSGSGDDGAAPGRAGGTSGEAA
jgi:hypothetical protein